VMTATHLYSFYPKLLSRRETVRGMGLTSMAQDHRLSLRGVQLVDPSAGWAGMVPCGEACLPVWRRTEKLEGVGITRWGGYCGDEWLVSGDDINTSNHKWRLGVHCSNSACQNSKNVTLI
jgi:hypothetical protein